MKYILTVLLIFSLCGCYGPDGERFTLVGHGIIKDVDVSCGKRCLIEFEDETFIIAPWFFVRDDRPLKKGEEIYVYKTYMDSHYFVAYGLYETGQWGEYHDAEPNAAY